MIVIENAATWHSYCRWNAKTNGFSAVVYGCGDRFADGVRYIDDIFAELGGPRAIVYFGDLDPRGLLIPQIASGRASSLGLPAVEPHLWSYRQLFSISAGTTQPWEGEPPSSTLCDWMGNMAEPVRRLFNAAQRIPQEYVGWAFLKGVSGLAND
jgi:hypothetical protein